MSISVKALQKTVPDQPFSVMATIQRRDPRPDDVVIDIKAAGICHSDIHTIRNEWGEANFPLTVGHEIAGVVEAVGQNVTDWKVGDRVGVGCMVDSCGECEECRRRAGAELPERTGRHLQRRRRRRHDHPGWLLPEGRRQRTLRVPHLRFPRLRRRRPAAVRGHHHLRTARPLRVPARRRMGHPRRSPCSASADSAIWACRSLRPWAPR